MDRHRTETEGKSEPYPPSYDALIDQMAETAAAGIGKHFDRL